MKGAHRIGSKVGSDFSVHPAIQTHQKQAQLCWPQVDFPLGDGDDPHGFACVGREVTCYYKHKHLRAAFSNIPAAAKDGSNVSTKVSKHSGHVSSPTLHFV